MSLLRQSDAHRKRVTNTVNGQPGNDNTALNQIVSWINGVVHGVSHFLSSPLGKFAEGITIFLSPLARAVAAATWAFDRVVAYIETVVEARIMTIVNKMFKRLLGLIGFYWQQTIKLSLMLFYVSHLNTVHEIAAERRARNKAIARAKAQLLSRIRHLHQTIEREAASGYRLGQPARTDIVTRLAEFIGVNNPVVRGLISDLVTGIIDLFGIDSAPARLLLGFIIKRIITKLGVDKVAAHYLDDILSPILGNPKPQNLHDVMADIASRLNAGEARWAQFFADGGSEVEQAGTAWQALSGPIGDAAILAWLGFAVTKPSAWAASINDTVGVVANDAASAIVHLLEGV